MTGDWDFQKHGLPVKNLLLAADDRWVKGISSATYSQGHCLQQKIL